MSVPSDLRDEIRVRLGSPTTTEISDSAIETLLSVALRIFNRYRPPEKTATLSLEADVSLYDPPSGVASGRIRRVYYSPTVIPSTDTDPVAPGNAGLSRDLAGLSPADNWVEAYDHRASETRARKLYGGKVFVEAGKVVVTPAPEADLDVLLVYAGKWTWSEIYDSGDFVDADAESVFEDLALYALGEGFATLADSRRRVRSVSRIGQSTTFASGDTEATKSETYRKRWKERVETARVGPRRG